MDAGVCGGWRSARDEHATSQPPVATSTAPFLSGKTDEEIFDLAGVNFDRSDEESALWRKASQEVLPCIDCKSRFRGSSHCDYSGDDPYMRRLDVYDTSKVGATQVLDAIGRNSIGGDTPTSCDDWQRAYEDVSGGSVPVPVRLSWGEFDGGIWVLGTISVEEARALEENVGAQDLVSRWCPNVKP